MAQREMVTVLFTDVVGSTALASRVGDEVANELRREHFAAIEVAVGATGGEIVKTLGDGAMCVYRSAADALAGAVALQRVVGRSQRRHEHHLAIRVGLAAGDATQENGDWFGTPVVVAARLCAAAPDGSILATHLVGALAGSLTDVQLTDVGGLELKGLPEPVPSVEVRWESTDAGTDMPVGLDSGDGAITLVGRDDELDVLTRAWKSAASGERRAVLLGGEPGVGKTRLATELARRVIADGGTVLHGRCDENLATPYLPFVEVLRARLTQIPAAERALETRRGGRELARLLPDLPQLIPGLPPPTRGDHAVELRLLFDAVDSFLSAAAVKAPLLVVLDDLHWADEPTIELVRYVLRATTSAFVCVVATYRDREVPAGGAFEQLLGEAARLASVDVLAVTGLDGGAVRAFVEAAAGHDLDDAGARLAEAIHSETAGNPFFIGEVVRHLAESGAVVQEDGRWRADADAAITLPSSVRDVLASRLARLFDPRGALRVGAVAGSPFNLKLVEAVTRHDELDALDQAVAALILTEPSPGQYAFVHALTRQAVLESVSAARRMRLHREVGFALAAQPDAHLHLSALAHHFAEAAPDGTVAEAADYALAAARAAIDSLALTEAQAVLQRALDIVNAEPAVDLERRCDLLLAMAESSLIGTDSATHLEWAERAVDDARAADSPTRFAQAVVWRTYSFQAGQDDAAVPGLVEEALAGLEEGDVRLRADLLANLAAYYAIARPEVERARDIAADAMRIAQPLSLRERSGILSTYAYALLGSPNAPQRLALADELEAAGELGDYFAWSSAVQHRGAASLELGDIETFDRCIETFSVDESLPSPALLAAWWRTTRALLDGRFSDAENLAAAALATPDGDTPNAINSYAGELCGVYREQGRLRELIPMIEDAIADNPALLAFKAVLAVAELEGGNEARARELLDELAIDDFASTPKDQVWPIAATMLTEVAAQVGTPAQARALYDLLLPHRGTLMTLAAGVIAVGAADRYLGIAAAAAGLDTADGHYRDALELESRIGSRPWLVRTRYWYARLLHARGDVDAATPLLDDAARDADDLGMAGLVGAIAALRT